MLIRTKVLETGDVKETKPKKNSQFHEVWRRLKKNNRAMIAMAFIIFLLIVSVFANVIADYDELAVHQNLQERFQTSSVKHWLGTDHFGRDLFARIIHGAKVSMLMGFCASSISAVISIIFGTTSVYFGGWVDSLITRIVDTLITIPSLLLAIAIVAGFGSGLPQLVAALAFGNSAYFTRVVRSASLTVVNQDYIEGAKARGASHLRIIARHIVPNIGGTILLQWTMLVATNILMGATLSFVGLGVQIPRPEWGSMLSEGLSYMMYYPHLVVVPGISLLLTTLAINTFGDCLRDALDPRLKGKA